MTQSAPAAFFSYSREDSDFALRLAGDLKAAGASVWLDQLDIVPGQSWAREVEQALRNAPRILVILSPASVKSHNVEDEISFALDEQKTVIPVFYRDCEIPLRLRRFHYVDFRKDYDRGLKELLKTLAPKLESGQGATPGPYINNQSRTDLAEVDRRERVADHVQPEEEHRKEVDRTHLAEKPPINPKASRRLLVGAFVGVIVVAAIVGRFVYLRQEVIANKPLSTPESTMPRKRTTGEQVQPVPPNVPNFGGAWELFESTLNGVPGNGIPDGIPYPFEPKVGDLVRVTQNGNLVRIDLPGGFSSEWEITSEGTLTSKPLFFANDGRGVTESEADYRETNTWSLEGPILVWKTTFDYKHLFSSHAPGTDDLSIRKYRRVGKK